MNIQYTRSDFNGNPWVDEKEVERMPFNYSDETNAEDVIKMFGRLLDTLASRNLITPKDVLHIVGVYQPDGAIEPKFV